MSHGENRKPGRNRALYVKHGRPTFFEDPAVDKLLAINMALLGEVCVLRERLDTHERLAAARGWYDRSMIDAYVPDAAAERERAACREATLQRVLSVLTEEVARLRDEAG